MAGLPSVARNESFEFRPPFAKAMEDTILLSSFHFERRMVEAAGVEMVEAAGVEPASENIPLWRLHACPNI